MPRALLTALLLLAAGTVGAQTATEIPLADVLEVFVLDRDLVAVDAKGGGQTTTPLRLQEQVAWIGSQGRVGVVLTDQRVLAVAVGSAAWQQADRRLEEVLPSSAALGDRVALVLTSHRAIGFDGGSGNLVESSLGLRERVLAWRTGENAAVVVTDRRALGLSPVAGGFFATKLQLEERLEAVTASANLATVTTNRRVLIFRSPSGSWEQRLRNLR